LATLAVVDLFALKFYQTDGFAIAYTALAVNDCINFWSLDVICSNFSHPINTISTPHEPLLH